MDVKIAPSWKKKLAAEFDKNYFVSLVHFLKKEKSQHTIYPPGKEIFSAFDHCAFDDVKVVIIGQDPYHGPGQANGLCFSVRPDVKIPPSLKNIFKELKSDLDIDLPANGDLSRWASQGVLLLNATLTVRAHQPGSHQRKGWEDFTDAAIASLNTERENLVFLLWGAYAQKKGAIIDTQRHLVLKSAHPSPFSADRGFFGNKHFSQTNEWLTSKGLEPVNW